MAKTKVTLVIECEGSVPAVRAACEKLAADLAPFGHESTVSVDEPKQSAKASAKKA